MKGHVMMIRRIGLAGFIAVLGVVLWLGSQALARVPSASISSSAWPMFRGNTRHTGQSSVNGPATNNVRWVYTATNFLSSSPAIAPDGTIYIGSWDNNLDAVNPNGTLKWTFPTGSYISSSPAIDSDGTIYVGSWDHNVYAVNPNGSLKWAYATNDLVRDLEKIKHAKLKLW